MAEGNKKTRDSGMELLRIISVLMVIGIHLFSKGNYYQNAHEVGGFVGVCSLGLRLLFRPAVNIFIIITGYYMVKMKFNLKKAYGRVLKLYLTVLFYSVLLNMVALIGGERFYTVNGETDSVLLIIVRMLLPITYQQWYFITDYILLCLFAPFVNIILQNIKKKDYQILLGISTFVMSIWFTLSEARFLDEIIRTYGFGDIGDGKNVFSFIYIYAIGGYIRLHTSKNEKPNPIYLLATLGCVFVNGLLATKLEKILELSDVTLKYSNPLVILMAVFLLMYFKDLHFYSKIVNTIASATLGVYIIHEFKYVRVLLWDMFNFNKVDCNNMFMNLVYIVSIIFMVFVAGVIVDLLRQKLFKMFERKKRVN
ncbi:MAG: acyltransferase [Lachnospiraceae bacterium]|nr:acyltransferase [Lachnospiraceae bacterium]